MSGQRGMTLIELLVAMSISLVITRHDHSQLGRALRSYANTVKRGKTSDFARLAI